jgi:hypothetical protein
MRNFQKHTGSSGVTPMRTGATSNLAVEVSAKGMIESVMRQPACGIMKNLSLRSQQFCHHFRRKKSFFSPQR